MSASDTTSASAGRALAAATPTRKRRAKALLMARIKRPARHFGCSRQGRENGTHDNDHFVDEAAIRSAARA